MNECIQPAALQPIHQLRRRNNVGELALGEVTPFAVMTEHIAHRHIGAAGVVQRGYEVRSDKTGPAGHQQHDIPKL